MATTLTLLRSGLAANLSTLTDVQVSAYRLADPTPPSAHIYPGGDFGDIEYDLVMGRGLDKWPFTVQVFVGLASEIGAQKKLDTFMAPSGGQSVKKLLESDKTLGGAATDVRVVGCTGDRVFVMEGRSPVLGASWHLFVLAAGT